MRMTTKGYKVFNSDWTCRGFQYKVGETYEEDVTPKVCDRGFHYCEKAVDCFNYYLFNPENKVAEVLALGGVDTDGRKSCTNKIQIVREIPWTELLELANTGKGCTGLGNSGNRNSGWYNTGNYNSGWYNTGNYNTGNWNTGNRNSGLYNTGNCNSGWCNTGDWNTGWYNTGWYNTGNYNSGWYNTGNYNTGNWNNCNFSNGCFNTVTPEIYMFNKPSEWTYIDWLKSEARRLLIQMPGGMLKYVLFLNMTDEEKEAHPEAEISGGYLKFSDDSESRSIWWRKLPDEDKAIIKSLPNFDPGIFKEITGVDVTEE